MTTLEWDEVFDCAVAAWCRSSTSQEMLRMCFQSRTQRNEVSVGWTANELMAFATGIARLVASPTPPAEQQAAPKAAPQPAPHLPERDASLPAERQGLFRKFVVGRVDGSDKPGGKHHGCTYFVLDVDHDPCARLALAAYAAACESTHPTLAADLRTKWGVVPAPQPAPAPLSDDVVKDAARWRMAALIGNEVMLHPDKRTHATAVKAYMDATHSGSDLTGAVDAALAAQGGKA